MFYGIVIRMYFYDNRRHSVPHFHADYADHSAVYSIPDGHLLAGALPLRQERLVQAWLVLHSDELLADWYLAMSGQDLFGINPL
jgi:hypothetical protein